jgi:hypothetical protein
MKPHETGTDNPIDFPKPMNKKELADNLDIGDALNIADHLSQGYLEWCPEAEWVLRAQHARIEELEARLDERADEVMSLENQIGMMTGYGHN